MIDSQAFNNRPAVKKRKLNPLPENPESSSEEKAVKLGRFPSWLHRKLPTGTELGKTKEIMRSGRLHTVCEEAKCPNLLECWTKKTATFLIMGKECTRSCGFCDIDFSKAPMPLEVDEPQRVAESAKELGLKHVVITMVARDDIPDQGASHIVNVIHAVRNECPGTTIEILTSDFNGDEKAVLSIIRAQPDIFNHNIETVKELTPRVRHTATYERSLWLLTFIRKHSSIPTKSGIMVGLGETEDQVHRALHDLKESGVSSVTIGQYLQPNRHKLRVKEFVTPEQFDRYAAYGKSIGIPHMYCGPFVRSSYNAHEVLKELKK